MRRLVPVIACVALGLGACSSSDEAADGTTTSAPEATTTTATTAPACTPSGVLPVGRSTQTMTVDGQQRSYFVYVPEDVAASPRLVVQFHGAGSNKEQQAVYSGFEQLADEGGFIVATPDGKDGAVRQWDFLAETGDIDFAEAIVDRLVTEACVDPAKVAATGISSGGAMTAALACRAGDTFTGFGPVAANFYLAPLCEDAPMRPMVIFHGTADATVPYDGGPIATGSGLSVEPAETNAAKWAAHNGCDDGPPAEERLSSEVVRLSYEGCTEPVVLYRIEGGGHTWPGSEFAVARLGATTDQISASETMLEFWDAAT